MPSTKNINLSGPNKYLFVSPNGKGKTIAAASIHKILPPGSTIYFFDFDGRMNPVRFYYPEADIEYDTFGPKNFQAFRNKLSELQQIPKYAAVILDSITSLSISCVNYQLDVKGKGGKTLGASGIQVTTWDEINGETILITQVLDFLKTYPGTVIITAHPVDRVEIKADGKEGGRKFQSLLAYGPKVAGLVPNYFNEIYTFTTETNVDPSKPSKRIALTQDDGVNLIKSALPLPPSIDWTNKDFFPLLRDCIKDKGVNIS